MNKLIIISYSNFLQLKEKSRKILSECDDFFVSINKEDYVNLDDEEKKKLVGVALTDEKHNAKIIETIKTEDVSSGNVKFYLNEIKPDIDVKISEESFREKHREYSKPYCPKKIYNKNFNTKKKGGR